MNLDRSAEQAVIGALLLEPARFSEVSEWLEPDDFDGLAERQAYEAIRDITASGTPATPSTVSELLQSSGATRPGSADAPFLVSCMQACPVASRAAVYGRMVLDTSIRRRVSIQVAGLRHRAEQAVTTTDLNMVFARVDRVRRDVERLHLREAKADQSFSPTPLRADDLPPAPRTVRRFDVAIERTAVLALVDQPLALSRVTRWLERSDFSDPDCRLVYGELEMMLRERKPIDPLTVAWRTSRRTSTNAVVEALVDLQKSDRPRPDATSAARRVLEQSVRGVVIDATRALELSAEQVVPDVATTAEAYERLNALWRDQRRLIRAGLTSA
jgi:replicative DNA helicase